MKVVRTEKAQEIKIKTICVECSGYLETSSDSEAMQNSHYVLWRSQHCDDNVVWNNQYCKASPLPMEIDPVSGENRAYSYNSLGNKYYSNELYENCRDVNTGNCKMFKKKGGPLMRLLTYAGNKND